ncbi:MAG: sulfite exporter TauE/SafE family protein [Pirellulaceae bacterium]
MDLFLIYFPLCLAALLAGIVNALAGGGTLLTFPALKSALGRFGDLADSMANGTSTIALGPASLSSAWAYRREIAKVRHWLTLLLIPSLLGGGTGAWLAAEYPKQFRVLVPWLILLAALLFTLQPFITKRLANANRPDDAVPSRWAQIAVVFAQLLIGLYGGYFGAGIGILMLSTLGLMGLKNIHEMNALKSVLAGSINGMAIVIFVFKNLVVWDVALAMMATSILGGYLGARYGRLVKQQYIRWFVIAVGFTLAAWYFYQQFFAAPLTRSASESEH